MNGYLEGLLNGVGIETRNDNSDAIISPTIIMSCLIDKWNDLEYVVQERLANQIFNKYGQ